MEYNMSLKTSIWKKFFRKGFNAQGGGYAARYDGWMAKHEARTTRTKMKRMMDKIFGDTEI